MDNSSAEPVVGNEQETPLERYRRNYAEGFSDGYGQAIAALFGSGVVIMLVTSLFFDSDKVLMNFGAYGGCGGGLMLVLLMGLRFHQPKWMRPKWFGLFG